MVVEMKMMQDLNLLAVVGLVACWGAVALAWLAGAIYFESQAPAERTRARYVSPMWISTLAAVAAAVAVPQADWRSLTFYAPPVRILGLAILLAATALTIWARLALGVMWSAAPAVKQEHKLRTGGPYAVTRHPIYTGLLGMMLGSLLLAGAGRWIVAFPVYLVLLEFKMRVEERLMLAEFPGDYPGYRRRVPQLVPGLRLASERRLASSWASIQRHARGRDGRL
jgi:protein-S-isoprenylcysteine O-methyltransferase Ste14